MLEDRQCSLMQIEGLVWEVLLHLPIKSLMRFKCMSKLWYSIIRNPKFAIAHSSIDAGGCFRGIFISSYHYACKSDAYFYVTLNDRPRLMNLHLSSICINYHLVTRPVKGLMGLYNYCINEFTLCNIATNETLKLPPLPSSHSKYDTFFYALGFDPVKEVYKVLSRHCCYDDGYNFIGHQYHVFTLGVDYSDLKWRDIAPMPSSSSDLNNYLQQCLCINGSMYWLPVEGHVQKYLIPEGHLQEYLTVFHLNSETFETIEVPYFEEDVAHLVEICGSLALVIIDKSTEYLQMFDVWTMNNQCRGGELELWTRKRVRLTTSLDIPVPSHYSGTLPTTLPTGEMLLVDHDLYNFPFPIYIVDHLKNEANSLIVEGHRSQENDMRKNNLAVEMVCYFEENCICLRSLMNNEEQDQTSISN